MCLRDCVGGRKGCVSMCVCLPAYGRIGSHPCTPTPIQEKRKQEEEEEERIRAKEEAYRLHMGMCVSRGVFLLCSKKIRDTLCVCTCVRACV